MIKISWDNKFKRSYRKKVQRNPPLIEQFQKAVKLFAKNPFEPSLKTHKLTGKLEGIWAFSISYEYRVIFTFPQKKDAALFIDFGTHNEVY